MSSTCISINERFKISGFRIRAELEQAAIFIREYFPAASGSLQKLEANSLMIIRSKTLSDNCSALITLTQSTIIVHTGSLTNAKHVENENKN